MNISKQIVGIDVSKDTLNVCYGTYGPNNERNFSKTKIFSNNKEGHKKLLNWADTQTTLKDRDHRTSVIFVCEATGIYHENLLYFLSSNNMPVSVILPNKAKAFSRTRDMKSKTDKIDARMLTELGLEKELKLWKNPNITLKKLKQLSRAIKTIKDKQTAVKNQLHAIDHSYESNELIRSTLLEELAMHKKNIKKYEKAIKELIKADKVLEQKINNILPAKGIGLSSIVTVISETDGFALIENSKQLASYAGMDVVHRESGLYKGKTKISKKGNSHIRSSLYMPALSAKKSNRKFKEFYDRIIEKRKIPGIAIIAVARKILLLIYILWKKNELYDPNYKTI